MNETNIASFDAVVAPQLLNEIATHAQNGSCAMEYIGSLARAISLALGAIEVEDRARCRHRHMVDLGPLADIEDWKLIESLLNLLGDQVRLAASLFEKLECPLHAAPASATVRNG